MDKKLIYPSYIEAIISLSANAEVAGIGENLDSLVWSKNPDNITNEQIETKLAELQAAYPMCLLREERNQKLAETDWWVLPDRTASQAQKDYRQALRDLPSTASPKLDEQGNLTNVTWPTKPT